MSSAPEANDGPQNFSGSDVVRKSNEAIGLHIKSGSLSLTARKCFNITVWHAQDVREAVDESGRWGMPVSKLIKGISFNSNDYDILREALDELQTTQVLFPEPGGGFTSEVLIPSYTLDNVAYRGLGREGHRKKGGELWLWFMFPPKLKASLLNPQTFTKLPLGIMGMIKSVPALALYEICRRYATSPWQVTAREDWDVWWRLLSGAPQDNQPPEYKYAKRDVFKRAVEEVNRLADIDVEMVEFKSGKSVKQIQFKVRLKQQAALEIGPAPIDTGLLARLTSLGFSLKDAERLIAKHSEQELATTADLTSSRLRNTTLPPLESAAAYFRKALAGKYAETKARVEAQEAKSRQRNARHPLPIVDAKPEETQSPEMKKAESNALDAFSLLPPEQKAERLAEFIRQNPALAMLARRNPDGPIVRAALARWLADDRNL